MFYLVAQHMEKVGKCVDSCKFYDCPSWHKRENFCTKYQCRQCKKVLKQGEPIVKVVKRRSQENGTYRRAILIFHRDCYLEHIRLWIDEQLRLHPPKPQKIKKSVGRPKKLKRPVGRPKLQRPVRSVGPRGRPKKSSDPKMTHRLKVLRDYYKGLGNQDKVEEIIAKIETLNL